MDTPLSQPGTGGGGEFPFAPNPRNAGQQRSDAKPTRKLLTLYMMEEMVVPVLSRFCPGKFT